MAERTNVQLYNAELNTTLRVCTSLEFWSFLSELKLRATDPLHYNTHHNKQQLQTIECTVHARNTLPQLKVDAQFTRIYFLNLKKTY